MEEWRLVIPGFMLFPSYRSEVKTYWSSGGISSNITGSVFWRRIKEKQNRINQGVERVEFVVLSKSRVWLAFPVKAWERRERFTGFVSYGRLHAVRSCPCYNFRVSRVAQDVQGLGGGGGGVDSEFWQMVVCRQGKGKKEMKLRGAGEPLKGRENGLNYVRGTRLLAGRHERPLHA